MHSFNLHPVLMLLLAITLFCGCQRSSDPKSARGGQVLGSDGANEVPTSSASDETSGVRDDGRVDQKAIMKLVNSYVTAFNQGDAAAVVEHWSKDGVYVNRTTGDQLVGREAIEATFREMFADGPVGELQLEILWRTSKRVLRWGSALLVVLLLLGFSYEQYSINRRARELQPPGQLVDIGGRSLHLNVQGSGSPTRQMQTASI